MSRPVFSRLWSRFNEWANRHEAVMIFLLLVLVLRLPNLAEPYWYGDEAIYLTIGVALKNGAVLYRDIVDHKTPLIYFFAMVPNQFWFRILLLGTSLISTTAFFCLAKRWLGRWQTWLATLVFVLFTSLPWLEGHIPNGELFVIGFMLSGMLLAARAGWWSQLETFFLKKHLDKETAWQSIAIAGSASLLGLGFLTKVPAVLDIGAIGAVVVFSAAAAWPTAKSRLELLRSLFLKTFVFVFGFMLPIGLSVVYFWLRGAAADYLQFGLLYNLHYTSNWGLPFSNHSLIFLFSLLGKALVLGLGFTITLGASAKWPKQALPLWVSFWSLAALFGSLLSNRPYPHYLLQVIPPLALSLGFLFQKQLGWFARIALVLPVLLTWGAFKILGFGHYGVATYYSSAWKLLTNQIEPAEYRHSFNWLVEQNEALVPQIQELTMADQPIFIWGTNPMLYAQAQRQPATRFTVAFHIHDLKNYDETLSEIQASKPKVIVLMRGEQNWTALNQLLDQEYYVGNSTNDMQLYIRRVEATNHLVE